MPAPEKENSAMCVPFSLIVDDGAPVNISYWTDPGQGRNALFANSLARGFADVCARAGAAGKFTVMPMPAGIGRIDRPLPGVPAGHVRTFLRIVRQSIAPRFDITPEFLTHAPAVDIKTGRFRHVYEDVWADQATVAEMTEYFAFAFRILKAAGLNPDGLTSPWMAGVNNEKRYAEAVARATRRALGRTFAWYFLHCLGRREPRWPWVAWRDSGTGLVTVTVPANTDDPFWRTQRAASRREARRLADEGVEQMLSADGRTGRIRDIIAAGRPVILLTHWQSLDSSGRHAGLAGLDRLFRRIGNLFGAEAEWMKCSRLARLALKPRPARGRSAR